MSERYALVHGPTDQSVAIVEKAVGVWQKGIGLLGRRALPPGEGLWLPGVASVHTVGMRFPIDLLFLDRAGQGTRMMTDVPPGRVWIGAPGACHAIELGVGTLAEWQGAEGDHWKFVHL